MPLSDVLTPLNLNESLTEAVLFHARKMGRLLQSVEKLEQADETRLTGFFNNFQMSSTDFNLLTLEAHQWMFDAIHDKPETSDA